MQFSFFFFCYSFRLVFCHIFLIFLFICTRILQANGASWLCNNRFDVKAGSNRSANLNVWSELWLLTKIPVVQILYRKKRKAKEDKREADEQALVDGEEDLDANDDDAAKVTRVTIMALMTK